MFKGTVKGGFRFSGKTAPRQFPHFQMILDAFAADPLFWAGIVSAVASNKILLLIALHENPLVPTFHYSINDSYPIYPQALVQGCLGIL
jgi:hypothetical protein